LPTAARLPFATRNLYKGVLANLNKRGYDYVAGLEIECHIFKREETRMAPEDAGQPGRRRTSVCCRTAISISPSSATTRWSRWLEFIRRDMLALGLPLRSVEVEYGPSQCEFTFQPTTDLMPADSMVLFRSAVKQICHRRGYHATFMCRPKIPNVVSSGWHLHQSIVSRDTGKNLFMSTVPDEALSPFGCGYLAGLLAQCARCHRVHHPDHQRLQALPFLFAGAGGGGGGGGTARSGAATTAVR